MAAEFEANLGHLRTPEGMAPAKRNGKLKGKQPKLSESACRSIRRRYGGQRDLERNPALTGYPLVIRLIRSFFETRVKRRIPFHCTGPGS